MFEKGSEIIAWLFLGKIYMWDRGSGKKFARTECQGRSLRTLNRPVWQCFCSFYEVFLNIFQKRLMFISISLFFVSYSKIKSYPGVWFKPYYSSRKTSSNLWKKDIGHHWFLFIPNSDSTKLAMRRFYFDIFQGILIFSKRPEFLFQ